MAQAVSILEPEVPAGGTGVFLYRAARASRVWDCPLVRSPERSARRPSSDSSSSGLFPRHESAGVYEQWFPVLNEYHRDHGGLPAANATLLNDAEPLDLRPGNPVSPVVHRACEHTVTRHADPSTEAGNQQVCTGKNDQGPHGPGKFEVYTAVIV